MKYCKTCLQTDTRPGIKFNSEGICPACDYYFNIHLKADFDERFRILEELIKNHKGKDSNFDCIIGVSGGKDSTRQALWVRDKLGLTPLLVCLSYPPEQITKRGSNNISNLINLGFDTIITSLKPKTWKKSVKNSFLNYLNWAKSCEQALFSSVPQIAIKYGIKLIFWGENPALQLGDLNVLGKNGYDGNNLRKMNTIKGGNIEWMIEDGFEKSDVFPYKYPSSDEFDKNDIQIIYLGWFWKDWSIINNGTFSASYGLELREDSFENTGDLWGCFSLDEDWVTLNQMIKYYKFGFGRVNEYCNEAIRNKLITRNEGIKLIEEYEGKISEKYIKEFCKYIDISLIDFWDNVKKGVNKDLFKIEKNGQIKRIFKVGIGL